MGTRHRWAPRHNPMQLRCDSPTRKNTPIIAHEKKCYQGAKILSQHIVTVVTNVTVPYSNNRHADGCRIIIVTGSFVERDQETALSRTTSDTATARKTLILTAHEIDMLSGAHHHCHGISSHSATKQLRSLERRTTRGYLSFSYDCYTSPNI